MTIQDVLEDLERNIRADIDDSESALVASDFAHIRFVVDACLDRLAAAE